MGNAREQVHQSVSPSFHVFILAPRKCANAIIGRGTPRGSGGVIVATTIPNIFAIRLSLQFIIYLFLKSNTNIIDASTL
jgi:hypothetical protein